MFAKLSVRRNTASDMSVSQHVDVRGNRLPLRVRWAAWRFAAERYDYYDYVASCLSARARHRSLLDLLQADAVRHHQRSARGVLSSWWASKYLTSGANLAETFDGTLPAEDVACLEMSRQAGQEALVQMLQAMSHRGSALEACRRTFIQTILAGIIALTIALTVLIVLPLFSLTELLHAFSTVDPTLAGPSTRAMTTWVQWLKSYGVLIPLSSIMAAGWVIWSLHGWVGEGRDRLDGVGIWRFERDRQAIQFLSLTATLVRNLAPYGVSLRTIIEMQLGCAQPWMARHLMKMLSMMDLGVDPLDALNTGLLDEDSWIRLHDVVLGHGLIQGFSRASERVQSLLVSRLSRQAVGLRWVMLIFSVTVVLGVGAWHARVMEEMRQAMLLGLSGI